MRCDGRRLELGFAQLGDDVGIEGHPGQGAGSCSGPEKSGGLRLGTVPRGGRSISAPAVGPNSRQARAVGFSGGGASIGICISFTRAPPAVVAAPA
jgi:hypothetical protein